MNRAPHINDNSSIYITLECWTECHLLPILIPKGKSNEFEQNVHEPGSFISCTEMLPPCHKWTNTICLRQNGASYMKMRTVFCLFEQQLGIGVRCQWIVAVEQTIRMKIQLDYEMFIPERYGTSTISLLFILLYITEYFSF